MLTIRGNSGIGDAIYTRAVVEYYLGKGDRVTVCTNWPDVFAGLACTVEPFRRDKVSMHAVYSTRKKFADTNQWQDVCFTAGVPSQPLAITWKRANHVLIDVLRRKAEGRPLVLVHGGRTPMGRTDGFGKELLPKRKAFECVLSQFADAYTVRVGKGADLYSLPVNNDLNGSTSVSDLLDLGQACDGIIGQCSLAVPLAEAFDKPGMFVWSQAGLENRHQYIRQITPNKILSKQTSWFVMDSWSDAQIKDEVNAFRLVR